MPFLPGALTGGHVSHVWIILSYIVATKERKNEDKDETGAKTQGEVKTKYVTKVRKRMYESNVTC